jgi:predicted GTPase
MLYILPPIAVKYATYLYNTRQKQPEWYIYVNEERLSEVKYATYLYNTRQKQPEWYIFLPPIASLH